MSSLWTKTMLSVWAKLPRAINNQDRYINTLVNRAQFGLDDALREIERIRQAILRKKDLQYFLSIIDEIYEEIDGRNKRIFAWRFVDRMTMPQISKLCNVPLRTVYRIFEKLLKSFERARIVLEYDDDYLNVEMLREKLIFSEYMCQQVLESRANSLVETQMCYYLDNHRDDPLGEFVNPETFQESTVTVKN